MSDPAIRGGGDRQLFLDDALIDTQQGLSRRWHQPVKHPAAPVIPATPERDPHWSAGMKICFGSVIHIERAAVFSYQVK